jgi:hypothetical protein
LEQELLIKPRRLHKGLGATLSLVHYINCLENCNMKYVEALAMLGLVVDVNTENCENQRFRKIIVKLFNGDTVSTTCYFEDEVQQSVKIIRVYIDIARRNNAIGKLQVTEPTGMEE